MKTILQFWFYAEQNMVNGLEKHFSYFQFKFSRPPLLTSGHFCLFHKEAFHYQRNNVYAMFQESPDHFLGVKMC